MGSFKKFVTGAAIVGASFGSAKAQTADSTRSALDYLMPKRTPVVNLLPADTAKPFIRFKTLSEMSPAKNDVAIPVIAKDSTPKHFNTSAEVSTLTATDSSGFQSQYTIYGLGQEIIFPVGSQKANSLFLKAHAQARIENRDLAGNGKESKFSAKGAPGTMQLQGEAEFGYATPYVSTSVSGYIDHDPAKLFKMTSGAGLNMLGGTEYGNAGGSISAHFTKDIATGKLVYKTDGNFFATVVMPQFVPELSISVGTGGFYYSSGTNTDGLVNQLSATLPVIAKAEYVFADGKKVSAEAVFNSNLTVVKVNYHISSTFEVKFDLQRAAGFDANNQQNTTNKVNGGVVFIY